MGIASDLIGGDMGFIGYMTFIQKFHKQMTVLLYQVLIEIMVI